MLSTNKSIIHVLCVRLFTPDFHIVVKKMEYECSTLLYLSII